LRAQSRPSCSRYIGFQSANVTRSPCRCTRHCTTSCLRIWQKTGKRLPTCVCHWTPNNCVRRTSTSAYSAVNQRTSWRSLIRCCWTSPMKQSANPAARVEHYTRTVSTSTQNTSRHTWSLTTAAPSDIGFRALGTHFCLFTSLL